MVEVDSSTPYGSVKIYKNGTITPIPDPAIECEVDDYFKIKASPDDKSKEVNKWESNNEWGEVLADKAGTGLALQFVVEETTPSSTTFTVVFNEPRKSEER